MVRVSLGAEYERVNAPQEARRRGLATEVWQRITKVSCGDRTFTGTLQWALGFSGIWGSRDAVMKWVHGKLVLLEEIRAGVVSDVARKNVGACCPTLQYRCFLPDTKSLCKVLQTKEVDIV